MRRVLSLCCVAALVVAGACGGNDDDETLDDIQEAIEEGNLDDIEDAGDPGELPDACELVTQEDAEELFGEAAERGEETAPIDLGTSCVWKNVDGEEVGQVAHLLLVNVFEGDAFYDPEAGEAIDDLGSRASVQTGEGIGEGVDVQFVEDGRTVTVGYSTVNIGVDEEVIAADKADDVIALARQASERM